MKRMENQNICLFVPYHKDYQSIHTVHFVLETEPQTAKAFRTEALYKVHLVRTGSGLLHTVGTVQPLSAGDVFFTFAGMPYRLESGADFSYLYISFLGARANQIMEKLGISPAPEAFAHAMPCHAVLAAVHACRRLEMGGRNPGQQAQRAALSGRALHTE